MADSANSLQKALQVPHWTKDKFVLLLAMLGGSTLGVPLSPSLVPEASKMFREWKESLTDELATAFSSLATAFSKLAIEATEAPGRSQLDFELVAWYEAGERIKTLLRVMHEAHQAAKSQLGQVKRSAMPWSLADVFWHFSVVSLPFLSSLETWIRAEVDRACKSGCEPAETRGTATPNTDNRI